MPPHEGTALKPGGGVSDRTMHTIVGLICGAAIIKCLDESVIGGMLHAFEEDFGVSATALAVLLMCSGLTAAISGIGWGLLADHRPRHVILMVGSGWWGLATLFVGSASRFWMLCIGRALTGAALSAVLPVSQSMVADLVPTDQLGHYYSVIGACGGAGSFAGQLISPSVSEASVGTVRGWRIVLWTIGSLSLLLAAVVKLVGDDPAWRARQSGQPVVEVGFGRMAKHLHFVCRSRTFLLIVLQGVFGAIPWSAIDGFGVLMLRHVGFSGFSSACLISLTSASSLIGNVLGGYLGDRAERRNPNTGRVHVAQASVLFSILVSVSLFTIIPPHTGSASAYGAAFISLGILGKWCFAGVNQPLLAQLVPPNMRATIMATEVALEGSSASIIGGPVLGVVAQYTFGYQSIDRPIEDISDQDREHNVYALRSALALLTIVPWTCCLVLYALVGVTFASDRDRVRASTESQLSSSTSAKQEQRVPDRGFCGCGC